MTVSSTVNHVEYTGAGTTGPFSVPFYFLNDSDLIVTLVDSDGVETVQTITTHYTVSGAGNSSGGSVTTVTAVSASEKIRIERDPALTQTLDLVAGDSFPVDSVEREFDKSRMISQRHRQLLNRAAKSPYGETGITLPASATRAGKVLSFDESGNPVVTIESTDVGGAAAAASAAAAAISAAAAASSEAAAEAAQAAAEAIAESFEVTIVDYGASTTDSSVNKAAINDMAADVGMITVPATGTFSVDGNVDIDVPYKSLGGVLEIAEDKELIFNNDGHISGPPGVLLFSGDGRVQFKGGTIWAEWIGFNTTNSRGTNKTNWDKFIKQQGWSNNPITVLFGNGTYKCNAPFVTPQKIHMRGQPYRDLSVIEIYSTENGNEHGQVAGYVPNNSDYISWDEGDGSMSLLGTPDNIVIEYIKFDCSNMTHNSSHVKFAANHAGTSGCTYNFVKWTGPTGANQLDGLGLVTARPIVERNCSAEAKWTDPLFVSKHREGSDRLIHVDIGRLTDVLTGTSNTVTIQVSEDGETWETYVDPDPDIGSSGTCVFTEDQDWIDLNDEADLDTETPVVDKWFRIGIDEGDYSSGTTFVRLAMFDEKPHGCAYNTYFECDWSKFRDGIVLGRHEAIYDSTEPASGGWGNAQGGKIYENWFVRCSMTFAVDLVSTNRYGVRIVYWDESAGHGSAGDLGPYNNHFYGCRIKLGDGTPQLTHNGVSIDASSRVMTVTDGELLTELKPKLDDGIPVAVVMGNQDAPYKSMRVHRVDSDTQLIIHQDDVHDENRTMSSNTLKMNMGTALYNGSNGQNNTFIKNHFEHGFHDTILLGENQVGAFFMMNKLPDNLMRTFRWLGGDFSNHETVIMEWKPGPLFYIPANTIAADDDPTDLAAYWGSYANSTDDSTDP